MITIKDIYEVLVALVPLYTAMLLGYSSVRWWKIFTPEHCAGINRFVAMYAIPFLSFNFMASNNIYTLNLQFLAADCLQKIVVLFALILWKRFTSNGSTEWMITLFSLCSLPNTLVMGVPLLRAMYGDYSVSLMVQLLVAQIILWKTLLIFLYEYREAMLLISEKFPDSASSISSIQVESDIDTPSRKGQSLQADAETQNNGKVHLVVMRSSASSFTESVGLNSTPSDITGIETYSVKSSQESTTPRASSFKRGEEYITIYPDHKYTQSSSVRDFGSLQSRSCRENSEPKSYLNETCKTNSSALLSGIESVGGPKQPAKNSEVHVEEYHDADTQKLEKETSVPKDTAKQESDQIGEKYRKNKQKMPSAGIITRLVIIMVWRKLVTNVSTYSSLLGLAWSLISFKWQIQLPRIVKESILVFSRSGLGMCMFNLGLFIALQPKFMNCRRSVAVFSLFVRFLTAPAVMAATAYVVGLRGVLLHIAILQGALPQAFFSFVYAKEYNLHAEILSTTVCFGMLVSLPVLILYNVLLEL